jgi:hypothetical protein
MATSNRGWERSLDQRDSPDGRARPPGELLDNLRHRLSELPASHPSAQADLRSDRGPGQEPDQAAQGAGSQDEEFADAGSWPGGEFPSPHRAVDPGTAEPGQGGRREPGSRPGGWAGGAARATATGLAALATMELPARARTGDPYRPWFMAGEPGAPWWASGGSF